MATAGTYRAGDRPSARWLRYALLLAALVLAALLAMAWPGLRGQAIVATAFAARTGCVCRFVSERDIGSCKGDLAAARLGRVAGLVSLSEDAQGHAVKASVPLLASQTATFAPDRGCQLEPWTR
ncbi:MULTISPECIES: hypothetical protein [Sphingomonadaceae]|uniref:hypothetical protein n=1 Tax=Sphingomonadaceae TaxID=41297 RepID=UPI001156EF90|nr:MULTISPECIES: hypothetical protein [Sphingomonadaceae]QDK34263.1 hypothetical protein DM450_16055 [Sphingomonas sp. IC081]QSR16929.1 hypothetical protein CA833_06980 [Novosphingobium sp. KA1]